MTTAILIVAANVIVLVVLIWHSRRQHAEVLQWLDAIGEMVGEALEEDE